MQAASRRSSFRLSATWLFWLALSLAVLLPLAQSAAALHAYSHVHAEQRAPDGPDLAAQEDHCDLCLGAAALAGGALLRAAAPLFQAAGPDAAPREAAVSIWQGQAHPGYRSRAPPNSRP